MLFVIIMFATNSLWNDGNSLYVQEDQTWNWTKWFDDSSQSKSFGADSYAGRLSFSICLATRQLLWRAPSTYSSEVKNSPPAFSSCKLKVHF
jgi:hypothetical protein